MELDLSTDTLILFQHGFFKLNWTLLSQWCAMLILIGFSIAVSRSFKGDLETSKTQQFAEALITGIKNQVDALTSGVDTALLFSYSATLFLFILVSNLIETIPFFKSPTGSLSMTAGLAATLLIANPYFGSRTKGFKNYMKKYIDPMPFFLPFNILDDVTKTLSLSMRLYGNVLSGGIIAALLFFFAPFALPLIGNALSLLTGSIQAFVFAAIATVTVASGMGSAQPSSSTPTYKEN